MGDLIEVAELDSGKREPQIERLKPYAELVQARDRINDTACARGVRIEIRAFADISYIQADRRAVRTILDNLLTNAPPLHTPGRRGSARSRRAQRVRAVHRPRLPVKESPPTA